MTESKRQTFLQGFSEETPAPDHELKARRQDERDEERDALADVLGLHVEDVAGQEVFQLLLAPGYAAEEEDDACRSHDERDADDRFLRNPCLMAADGGKDECTHKGKREADPVNRR